MSDKQSNMKFYEAYSLIESVKKMTGNGEFERLHALVKKCEKTIELANEVFSKFPEKDDDNYYNSRPQTLKDKVNDRVKVTSDFMANLRGW